MSRLKRKSKTVLGTIVMALSVLITMAMCVAITYFVVNSDLPVWLKFLILR